MTAEYANNQKYYSDYYDEIEVYEKSMKSHFKKAYQMRNRYMVDRSDIVVFYVSHTSGGLSNNAVRKEKRKNDYKFCHG